VLALVDQPDTEHVREQLRAMQEAGAVVHRMRSAWRVYAALPWLLVRYRFPTVLPVGGSSRLGIEGWVDAALELGEDVRAGRLPEPATIVVPVGSGGTAAGLVAGLPQAGLSSTVVGVLVNDQTKVNVPRMARRTTVSSQTHDIGVTPGRFAPYEEHAGFLGDGYGHATPEGEAALEEAAAMGLTLEPVYTAKAWAAMRALELPGPVLFWQTYAGG
jgi:D-cysteine desulfhydrase